MVRKYPAQNLLRSSRQGFTLVEILCVVLVLAIASTILVPQIGSRDDLNAAAGAREVMADLTYAQNLAITTQMPQYVSFNVSGQSYAIYSSLANPLTPITHPVTGQPYVVYFGAAGMGSLADCSLTSVNMGGQNIIGFDPTGTPYVSNSGTALSGAGTIVIASGANSLTLSITQDTGDITCQ